MHHALILIFLVYRIVLVNTFLPPMSFFDINIYQILLKLPMSRSNLCCSEILKSRFRLSNLSDHLLEIFAELRARRGLKIHHVSTYVGFKAYCLL